MIHKVDLTELKRMATNLYDNDKSCVLRIIRGIGSLEAENNRLRHELKTMQDKKGSEAQ